MENTPVTNSQPPLSRKHFLSLTGRSLALTSLLASGWVQAQAPTKPQPPARVPAKPHTPIKLEEWKSDADPESAPTPTPLAPDQRVGFAVVGLGHLALEEVLPALGMCKKAKLVALVSGSPDKMRRVAAQYGVSEQNCYAYDNFDSIKDNPAVEVVYIILPNGLHHEYVIRTAKAGKHVLCEKPMANNSAECRDMIAACKSANVKLMVAYRMQYEPHIAYIKDALKRKEFGATKLIEATNSQSSANPLHWRHKKALAGGGALPDIGIYCLNTIRYLLDEEPTEVFAYRYSTPGNPLFKEVEELVSWQMRFPSGVIANCSTDYNVHESRWMRIMNERGWYNLDNAFAYKGQELKTSKAEGPLKLQNNITIPQPNQFATEMDYFAECIIEKKEPKSPGEEGLQDHILMEAIYRSAAEGKPVRIA